MKKILSIFLSACIICIGAFALTACGPQGNVGDTETQNGLIFTLVKNPAGGLGYTVKGADETATDIYIPGFMRNNRPIIGVEPNAFYGYTQLKSVSIPYHVTEIGENAFYGCTELESVSISANVKEIGESAFAKCENLKTVSVSSVESWCSISFANMAANPMYFATEFCVKGVPVEDLNIFFITEIPDFAFYECENIKSVTLGTATRIGNSAFYGCKQLESLKINGNVAEMGELAFADCLSLKNLQLGDQIKVIGEYAFLRCGQLTEVTVPASVKRIEASAFSDCIGLRTVNLNDGLDFIGDCAFSGCVALNELNMPSTVREIGFGTVMFGGNSGFEVGNTANQVGKITLSDKITEIPDYSFSYCGITEIAIGESVERIGYSAFYGCVALESVVIPKSLKNITSYAFYRCSSLNTVYYKGTANEWAAVKIGKNGNDISNAQVYYYSVSKPSEEGNFWHYDTDGKTPVKW